MKKYIGNYFIFILINITILSIYLPMKVSGVLLLPSLFFSLKEGVFFEIEKKLKLIMIAFLLFLVFFTLNSTDVRSSIKGSYDILRGFAFFPIALFFSKIINDLKLSINVSFFSISLILGNLFFFHNEGFFGYHENPNNTAFMLVFLLAFIFPFLFERNIRNRVIYYVLLAGVVLCFWLIFLTHSRGAVFGVLGAVFVCLFFLDKLSFQYKAFFAGIAIFFVGAIFVISKIKGFDLSGREELWIGLIKATIAERPILGYGINTVKNVIIENDLITLIAHNIFIEIFVSTGVFGIFVFSGILVFIVKVFFSLQYRNSTTFFMGIFGFSAFCLIGIFDLKFSSFRFVSIILFFLGLIYSQRVPKFFPEYKN